MERIVIADRMMVRVLALLPAVIIAVAVRLLTLGQPPLAVRLGAAAMVALAAWVGYRLLTTRVVVADHGLEVRGVLYEAEIPWADLDGVEVAPASAALRALVWGVMRPHGLQVRAGARTLRPLAAVSHDGDEDVVRAIGAIRARLGAWGVPRQRSSEESVVSL